jgi:hypothetical protein
MNFISGQPVFHNFHINILFMLINGKGRESKFKAWRKYTGVTTVDIRSCYCMGVRGCPLFNKFQKCGEEGNH